MKYHRSVIAEKTTLYYHIYVSQNEFNCKICVHILNYYINKGIWQRRPNHPKI